MKNKEKNCKLKNSSESQRLHTGASEGAQTAAANSARDSVTQTFTEGSLVAVYFGHLSVSVSHFGDA